MERTGNPIDDESHLDAGNVTKVIPTLLSPSFAVESKPNSYSDEDENEGDTYGGNNTGYLEILSSEDEEPKGNNLVDEIVVPHWIQNILSAKELPKNSVEKDILKVVPKNQKPLLLILKSQAPQEGPMRFLHPQHISRKFRHPLQSQICLVIQ